MKLSNYNQIYNSGLFIILSLGFAGCSSEKPINSNTNLNSSSEQASSEKKQQWQAMEKEVSSWGDALGMPIDPEIKKTVIVLNLLGFKTNASCEGHPDRALSYPWVDFETTDKQIESLSNEKQNIYKDIEEKEAEIQKKYPDLSLGEALRKEDSKQLNTLYPKLHTISDKIEALSKTKLILLKNLLNDFYKNRPTDPDRMIIIHELNPTFLRMYSLGGDWQITRNKNEKERKLKEYQQEMNSFADFLIAYYFSDHTAKR
jgi:hypothetical protein